MDQTGGDVSGGDPNLDVPPEVFIKSLEGFERVLIQLKEQLYEGSWDRVLEDLKSRLNNKPYIFKLSQFIARDVAAIERMKAYEQRHGVSLAELMRQQKAAK